MKRGTRSYRRMCSDCRSRRKKRQSALQKLILLGFLKNWSGRKDSTLRPPGPEPGDSHFAGFCTAMRIFHIVPVQLVSSMGCAPLALHASALSCRLWLHEKGKKRARFAGYRELFPIIVPILLVSACLSSACFHSALPVNANPLATGNRPASMAAAPTVRAARAITRVHFTNQRLEHISGTYLCRWNARCMVFGRRVKQFDGSRFRTGDL